MGRFIDNAPLRTAILDCFNPYLLPNKALEWSLKGAPGDASYLLDGSSLLSLMSDRSGNSAENCLVLNGASGNYASSPDSVALSITGDIDIRCKVAATDWTPAATNTLISKWSSTDADASYGLEILSSGRLQLRWRDSGLTLRTLNSGVGGEVPLSDFSLGWVRATLDVDNGSSNASAAFYWSSDGSNWNLLGTALLGSTTSINDGTAAVIVGGLTSSTQLTSGNICRAQIYSGIAGTVVFDADFTRPAKLASSFTESSVNAATVTINTSGDLGARISGARDYFQNTGGKRFTTAFVNGFLRALADGSNDYGASPSFSLPQPFSLYLVGEHVTFTNGDVLLDGRANDTAQVYQDTTTPNLSIYAGNVGPTTTQVPLATKHVIGMILNGANSYIGVDELEPILGNAGTATPNGITLAARAAGTLNGHLGFYELLAFNGAHSLPMFRRVRKALKRVNGIS